MDQEAKLAHGKQKKGSKMLIQPLFLVPPPPKTILVKLEVNGITVYICFTDG